MQWTRVAVLLCLAGICMGGDLKKLFKKHAEKKVMQACFGEKVMKDFFHDMKKYMKECEGSQSLSRGKRSMFTAEKIRELKDKSLAKTATVLCVLQKFKVIDNEFNLLPSEMKSEISTMDIDFELKQDLNENIDNCMQAVSCIPFKSQNESPLPPKAMKAFAFMKCEEKKKWVACIKKDLRKYKDYFDLQGLDGLMEDAEEDDKLFTIALAKAMHGSDLF